MVAASRFVHHQLGHDASRSEHLLRHLPRRKTHTNFRRFCSVWNTTLSTLGFDIGRERRTRLDSRIVIVDIDQHSQEVLGKWPFSRTHFAKMLDVLREDGAKVAAFDITFDKPDQTVELMRKIWKDLESKEKKRRAGRPQI